MNSIHDKLIKIHVLRLLASLKWLRYHLRPKCGKENKKKLYKNMSAYILQGVKQEILATALCYDCQTFALSERPERLTWTRLETARWTTSSYHVEIKYFECLINMSLKSGISVKADYQQSTAARWTRYHLLFSQWARSRVWLSLYGAFSGHNCLLHHKQAVAYGKS